MSIRAEEPGDRVAVHALNRAAFESPVEADLVDRLRGAASPIVALVAQVDDAVAGHILFTPVTLSGHPGLALMGLGPMAVAPEHQRRGIGSRLVREGLRRCRDLGCGAVVVLGHPAYYPRFGFTPASDFGIDCEFDVPDDVFLVTELQPGYLRGRTGTIRYHPAFGEE